MSSESGQYSRDRKGFGIPSNCHCGRAVVIHTSSSKPNPGRPYFRCPTRRDDHLFKWVEDGVYKEVAEVVPKLSSIEIELNKAKSEVAIEIQELKSQIEELKEDGVLNKREMKKWKVMISLCLICFCCTVFAIGFMLFKRIRQQSLVLGY